MKPANNALAKPETAHTLRPEPPTLSHTAVGTYKDAATGHWHTVSITFEPKGLQVGKIIDEDSGGPDRATAIERFKICAANKISVYTESN